MTPTPTITAISDKLQSTLESIRGGQRLDIYDIDNLRHRTVLLIWHLTHDPDYLASDPARQTALQQHQLHP
ncbi:hypothetical protein ES703_60842 [subsurface metagenome]